MEKELALNYKSSPSHKKNKELLGSSDTNQIKMRFVKVIIDTNQFIDASVL